MKKYLFLLVCMLSTFMSVQAQQVTVWYGIGYKTQTVNYNHESEFKFDNFGIDYSKSLKGKVDWTVGLGYTSKTASYSINYIQAEGNLSYRLLGDANSLALSALTGPYVAYMVKNDKYDWIPHGPDYKHVSYGWQIGAKLDYKFISLKAGFETALNSCERFEEFTANHYTFKGKRPYEFFIRIGYKL